jgi:hypothetical protein
MTIPQLEDIIRTHEQTIKVLVHLADELRQPFNNSVRHDLYEKANNVLNKLEAEGRLPQSHLNKRPKISYAEVAYEAYCKAAGWISHAGEPLPKWQDLIPSEREAFEATAQAVLLQKLSEQIQKN